MKFNFLMVIGCFVLVLYHFFYNGSVVTTPHMTILINVLCVSGGFNLGMGLSKLVNERNV